MGKKTSPGRNRGRKPKLTAYEKSKKRTCVFIMLLLM